MFEGSYVALVTPFSEDGSIDWKSWEELIDFHLENGTDGLVPCGTTGETPTLSLEEKQKLISSAIKRAGDRVPVIAGTGSYSTQATIELTKYAQGEGATGALVVTPYYNKPTPEGLFMHFEEITRHTAIPIMLYNVPSRTSLNMLPGLVRRLASLDNVKAIKEASGSLDQVMEICATTDLVVFSGDDSLTLPLLGAGGKGVVSVAANIIPAEMHTMVRNFLSGEIEEARQLAHRMYPLQKALFLETNPIPVKAALQLMGKISGRLRLPLCDISDSNLALLKKAMLDFGGPLLPIEGEGSEDQ